MCLLLAIHSHDARALSLATLCVVEQALSVGQVCDRFLLLERYQFQYPVVRSGLPLFVLEFTGGQVYKEFHRITIVQEQKALTVRCNAHSSDHSRESQG